MVINAQKQRKKSRGKPFEKGNKYAFKPGTSGNPSGVPTNTPRLSTAYKKLLGAESLKKAKTMIDNLADEIALGVLEKAVAGDVRAAGEIADRTEGKVPTKIEGVDQPIKLACSPGEFVSGVIKMNSTTGHGALWWKVGVGLALILFLAPAKPFAQSSESMALTVSWKGYADTDLQ